MAGDRVNADTDDFAIPAGEFGMQAGHVAEFCGAHRGEVFGMRKQHSPGTADPLMEGMRPAVLSAAKSGAISPIRSVIYAPAFVSTAAESHSMVYGQTNAGPV